MSGKEFFTVAEDEKLVEIVSKYPCLYDLSSPMYKDQTAKESAWKEIAELVERTGKKNSIFSNAKCLCYLLLDARIGAIQIIQ